MQFVKMLSINKSKLLRNSDCTKYAEDDPVSSIGAVHQQPRKSAAPSCLVYCRFLNSSCAAELALDNPKNPLDRGGLKGFVRTSVTGCNSCNAETDPGIIPILSRQYC
eukprot:3021895-Amphidinium_carterae.2